MIFGPSRKLEFGANQYQAFLTQLEIDAKNKIVVSISKPEELYLDSQRARVGGKYQMTPIGGEQLLNSLAKGLYPTIRSLVAEDRIDINHKDIPPLVAQVVNRITRHRFPAVEARRMVCCDRRQQIDGFVSKSYAMISNDRVMGLFNDACELMPQKMTMLRAELSGREMTFVVSARESLRLNGKEIGVYGGALCQNGETAGRAIRAANILLDATTKSWSVSPFENALRISHTKSRKLRDKMMAMGDELASRRLSTNVIAARLSQSPAKIVMPDWTTKSVGKFRGRLLSVAESLHVNASSIDEVMALLPPENSRKPPSVGRVYSACLEVADELAVGKSISLRQLAYKLMFL